MAPIEDQGGVGLDGDVNPARFFRDLVQHARDAIFVIEPDDGRIVWANPAAVESLGYEMAELTKLTIADVQAGIVSEAQWAQVAGELRSGRPLLFRGAHVRKDGTSFPVEVASQLFAHQGRDLLVSTVRNTTGWDIQETARKEAEQNLDVALRTMSEGVLILDPEGTFVVANNAFCRLTGIGRKAIEGKKPLDPWPVIRPDGSPFPGHEHPSWRTLKTREPIYAELQGVVRPEGKVCWLSATSVPILDFETGAFRGVLVTLRDVTLEQEAKNAEAAAQKMARLESIGTLAGGIAHDFNNLLTSLMGNVDLARETLAEDQDIDDALETLGAAMASLEQARQLTNQLLTFSKGGQPRKASVALDELAREVMDTELRGHPQVELGPRVPVEGTGNFAVSGDRSQLQQVISNLVLNAIQATQGHAHAKIEVRWTRISLDQGAMGLAPGTYVALDVEDNGPGIPEADREKILDPYFSTKRDGRGLGLAIVHSVVTSHCGQLQLRSGEGEGARFRVLLPPWTGQASSPTVPTASEAAGNALATRVLVLEDEPHVASVVAKMVRRLGGTCRVEQTTQATVEAYQQAMDQGRPYTLVIMDLTVPGDPGGLGAIEAVLKIDANATCLVSSGYAAAPVMSHPERWGFAGVLTKPYAVADFRRVLREIATRRD